jgi:hypothetical protein
MYLLLESREEIAKAQRKLEATLKRDLPRTATKDIGYPGGRQTAKVHTDGTHWFWSSDLTSADTPNPRRLNWFGMFRDDTGLAISVEINTANVGRNDQVAGFFARDSSTGAIYLFHSGRVGGGTKGVGKDALLAWSDLELVEVSDASGGVRGGVLVMPIEGAGASRSAIRYVNTIVGFKIAVREGEIETPSFQRKLKLWSDYYAEGRGRRKGRRSSEIDYVSRHGDVVDAVADWRNARGLPKGSRLVKDVLIDLGVLNGHGLTEVFEVKTCSARPNVYAAIGQLLVHGTNESCRRVIVLPHDEVVADDLDQGLRRLGIEILRFKLDEKKATIVS